MNNECEVQVRESMLADRRESGFVLARRIHQSLTAASEKRLLVWLAERTPKVIGPDHLTALGFVAQLAAGAAYALAAWDARALWLVNLFLVLNWLGDSLDGTLARVRDQQRPRYGFYVDHMADTFGALALMAGLACSGYVHWQMAAGCWFASTCSPSKAILQPIRWDTFTFPTGYSVPPSFEFCW